MNQENNYQYENIKNIYRNIPKYILSLIKITPLFWSQIFEKSGVILGTPKNGQKSKKKCEISLIS